jgi:hypothetical protein
MSDPWQRTFDLFVTHAWRYHDDWNRFADLMNGVTYFRWRNFSLPWYDPAIDVNTAAGKAFVADWLERQVIPCHAVIALDSVFSVNSARRWVEDEIRLARDLKKPVLGLPAFGAGQCSPALTQLVDRVIAWEGPAVADAVAKAAVER